MIGSLSGVIEALPPEIPPPQSVLQEGYGRMIIVEDHSRLNIYILLDTSGSLVESFDKVRQSAISLIRKVCTLTAQYHPFRGQGKLHWTHNALHQKQPKYNHQYFSTPPL
jgi:hypothetical protein